MTAAVGTALGLGLASGLSLYGTAFLTGLAIHLGWVRLQPDWAALGVLAEPTVLLVTGSLFAVELLADKVPWVDSAWDALHTLVRPIGGALLALRALGQVDPAVEIIALLLLGGATLTTHAAKASLRLLVNLSPEPVSNVIVSLAENGVLVGTVWLALAHPLIALGAGTLGLGGAAWLVWALGRRVARAVRARRGRSAPAVGAGTGPVAR